MITNSDINGIGTLYTVFLPYRTINWLVIVPVTNKVDRKLIDDQIDLSSFNMANRLQKNWSVSAHLLPLVKIQELHLKENHLVVYSNI